MTDGTELRPAALNLSASNRVPAGFPGGTGNAPVSDAKRSTRSHDDASGTHTVSSGRSRRFETV